MWMRAVGGMTMNEWLSDEQLSERVYARACQLACIRFQLWLVVWLLLAER
jgi:hypothetical protein